MNAMSKSIIRILKNLKNCKAEKNFKSVIEKVDAKVIKVLAEIALNIHKRRLGLSKSIKKGLLHFNDLLHKFGCCYSSSSSSSSTRGDIEKNRQVLLGHKSTRGSGLLRFVRFLIRAAFKILPQIVAKI